jgi:hypothetical protein
LARLSPLFGFHSRIRKRAYPFKIIIEKKKRRKGGGDKDLLSSPV